MSLGGYHNDWSNPWPEFSIKAQILHVFLHKHYVFCAGVVAENVNEAMKLLKEHCSLSKQMAELENYDIKIFILADTREKGVVFLEEE